MDWQPIETAPTDGTAVLCVRVDRDGWFKPEYCVAYWDEGAQTHEYTWVVYPGLVRHKKFPTHWMPLPPPPNVEINRREPDLPAKRPG